MQLPHYGINHGLTIGTAAYATGLLYASRASTKCGLAHRGKDPAEPDGIISVTGRHVQDAFDTHADNRIAAATSPIVTRDMSRQSWREMTYSAQWQVRRSHYSAPPSSTTLA
ncbi:hypothetical protein NM688_g290 [Phlebia brevispora]|uniref:Uncharacterized protein n=1 Tax=Phlebia brevispora TaxID=194682 RepID=A0ACC1TEM6_9APHY|nr:hypothetical protein NM688_g290 [Phlebia brevispora]